MPFSISEAMPTCGTMFFPLAMVSALRAKSSRGLAMTTVRSPLDSAMGRDQVLFQVADRDAFQLRYFVRQVCRSYQRQFQHTRLRLGDVALRHQAEADQQGHQVAAVLFLVSNGTLQVGAFQPVAVQEVFANRVAHGKRRRLRRNFGIDLFFANLHVVPLLLPVSSRV